MNLKTALSDRWMALGGLRNKAIFILAAVGLMGGVISAIVYSKQTPALPPLFPPATNPYPKAIYTEGIIESTQGAGQNINVYPEVSATITQVAVKEGQKVKVGDMLVQLDDSVQKATTEQLHLQAVAAKSLLDELKAQPRKEQLAVVKAQMDQAEANKVTAEVQYQKQRMAYDLNAGAVSRDILDNSENALKVAVANLDVAKRQLELTRAGAWDFDIRNQQSQYLSLMQSWQAAKALLAKYALRASTDGVVMALNANVGVYASPQGVYSPYTQSMAPVVVMSSSQEETQSVRCFVDEILISRMPPTGPQRAQLAVRGTDIRIPLEFVRIQPYVTPKIELSNQVQEKVDLRVLPVIFRFKVTPQVHLYPGQLVDVYIEEKP